MLLRIAFTLQWFLIVVLLLSTSLSLSSSQRKSTKSKGCHKTIRTTKLVRNPRVTSANRGRPLHCTYRFLRYGAGDIVFELNFKAFQVGTLVNTTTCSGAYVQIVDGGQNRSNTSGHLCGRLQRSRTFLSETDSVTLVFHSDSYNKATYFKAQASILPKRLAQERHKELAANNPGEAIAGTYCDRKYVDCRGFCDVMSPGYPGFYPRNVTCRYHIHFNQSDAQVTLGGQYYDSFSVWGGPMPPGQCQRGYHQHCEAKKLTNSCPHDYLQIYDVTEDGMISIGRFCGKGHLPRIVARGHQMVLEFHSPAAGSPASDGFYLSVGAEFRRPLRTGAEMSLNGKCDWVFRSSESLQGQFQSLRHWYPPGTRCSYRFLGQKGQRVWLHFINFDSSSREECHVDSTVDRLSIYDSDRSDDTSLVGVFCGRKEPNETALSSTEVYLVQFESRAGSYDGSSFEFSVLYMFVSPAVSGTPVSGTLCDQTFTSENVTKGRFDLLPDRLTLRERTLSCSARFTGRPTEHVRLTFSHVAFDPARYCTRSRRLRCSENEALGTDDRDELVDRMLVFDGPDNMVDCFCGSVYLPYEITSTGPFLEVRIELHNVPAWAYRDQDIYLFKGRYEFLQLGCGENNLGGQSGRLSFPSLAKRPLDNVHCRWNIKVTADRSVLLKFPYVHLPHANCSAEGIRMYSSGSKEPYAEICRHSNVLEVFPPGWYPRAPSSNRNHRKPPSKIVVELVSASANAKFKLLWTEVILAELDEGATLKTVQFVADAMCGSNLFSCPDKRTCIADDLVCNGVIDCPVTNFTGDPLDEALSHCTPVTTVLRWLFLSIGISFAIASLGISGLWWKMRHQRQRLQVAMTSSISARASTSARTSL